MALSLIPRELKFFDMFDEAADLLRRAAERLLALVSDFDRLGERAYEIRQDESACQEWTQRLVAAIDESFITPFDRENIHALAHAINDQLDAVEEAAGRFEVFHIDRPTPEAVLMARILRDCAGHVADALRLCRDWKNAEQVLPHAREVTRLEGEVDRAARDCDRALFANPPDPAQLIKWRELYGSLRDAVNATRRVAQCLSEIMVKGA
jgi:uncharacterized protein Yka (UPF0111/DUF47 family)